MTTTPKHTPEPWDLVYENGKWQGFHEPEHSGDFMVTFEADSKEDAERIVACVNAMAEHPDPEAFMQRAKELIQKYNEQSELIVDLQNELSNLKQLLAENGIIIDINNINPQFLKDIKL